MLALLLLAASPLAQAPAPEVADPIVLAVRLGSPQERPSVDGKLEEPAWLAAPATGGLRQREPGEGAAATEDTEVRVLYDDETLFIGILARDHEPGKVIARVLQRDRLFDSGFDGTHHFAGDDGVAILLDPFHDHRNAVVFATNPNGAQFDALITDENGAFNVDWRAVWDVAAARTQDGWTAEFAIPFRSLRYPAGEANEAWGVNVFRMIRRKSEEDLLAAWERDGGGFHRVSRAGRLLGLTQLPRRGLNLEIKPYALGGATQERAEFAADAPLNGKASIGLDAKWEVRSGLVLDATLNPDFAQVEADDQQLNLTRFDLFFPEKRDFFLENAGIFEFGAKGLGGGEPPPFLLFFSRQIGIIEDENEDAQQVPVRGGVRVSGRVGKQTLGVLDMATGSGFGEPATNFGVVRVKRDVGASHYVGAVLTDRRNARGSNTGAGLDASFWPTKAVNLTGFYARTATSGPGGDGAAYRVAADYAAGRFGLFAQHLVVGPQADAQMGFVTRDDIRRSDVFGRVTLRPSFAGLRKIDVFGGGNYVTNLRGETQDWNCGPFFEAHWNSGDRFGLFYTRAFTHLDEAFDLSDRVPVPVGDYAWRDAGVFFRTSPNRPAFLGGFVDRQRNWGGRVDSTEAHLGFAAGSHLTLSLGLTHTSADLPGGAFAADLASLRFGWAFSTRLTASGFVQWNGLDHKLLTNLRLNFVHRPGSDLYVVLNDERGSELEPRKLTNRGLAVKLTWLARF